MRAPLILTPLIVGIAAGLGALVGCSGPDNVATLDSNITEWATDMSKDEAYNTKYVIAAVCEKIYGHGSAMEACKSTHEFRLVNSKYSTKYGYLKAITEDIEAPIEVGQTLSVKAPGGATFTAELLRQFDEFYHLRWTVREVTSEGGGAPPVDAHNHIESVADDLGEYVDFGDSDDVKATTWEALPEPVQLSCEAVMLARAEMNSEGDYCTGSADWTDGGFGEIMYFGQTVGYICGIDDVLYDCSLWDGSGLWLFLDGDGEIVVETDWSA